MMHAKSTFIKSLSFLIVFFCAIHFGHGQIIVGWEMDGQPGDQTNFPATTIDPNLNPSILSRGSGLNPSAQTNSFNSNSFTLNGTKATAIANNDYLEFQISATTGYQVSLSTLDVNFQRTIEGPRDFIWRYSVDGINFNDIGLEFNFAAANPQGQPITQIDLAAILPLQNVAFGTTITFRLYGWRATDETIGKFAFGPRTGNDLVIGGAVSVVAPCTSVSKWNGTSWIPSAPTSNTFVIIEGAFDTSVGSPQTSFDACSLIIDPGVTLNVADNTFVKVQNNVTVNGTLTVQTSANFAQYGNIFTGTATVNKTTRDYYDAELHYVYWSSPVVKADVDLATTFPTPYLNRRYKYDGSKYADLDLDGLDDDRNDWQVASGTMDVGRGYVIATAPPPSTGWNPGEPYSDTAVFEGQLNTGDITVPIYRNETTQLDNNWNLIGNPYASAIDAEAFLLENFYDAGLQPAGTLYGVIYLWTHNTAASAANVGNYQFSFSRDDYASINLVGFVSGGLDLNSTVSAPNQTPTAYIPSGQGFFVSYANDSPSISSDVDFDTGEVKFNNSMRMADATSNSQFFKNSNTKGKTTASNNKLWVNLTSDNGVFNQILIGYLNLATNNYDGVAFDAPKYLSSDAPAILYTSIPDSDTKFVIQGKAENSLNENEVIPLGFDTKIEVATLYKLSVPYVQGDFLKNNKVYLKDNLLNAIHDLSESDYTFISEVGEFTNRFEIVFNAQVLSADTFDLDAHTVQIIQLDDTHVTFKASANLNIKTVTIYDLLGRQLYQLKGSQNEETYNLSNLQHSVFIAKVALSNGALITKKAIKK